MVEMINSTAEDKVAVVSIEYRTDSGGLQIPAYKTVPVGGTVNVSEDAVDRNILLGLVKSKPKSDVVEKPKKAKKRKRMKLNG